MIQIDMKIPKNCLICPFYNAEGVCVIAKRLDTKIVQWHIGYEDRPSWCPLKEVNDKQEIIIPDGYKPWRLGEES